MEQKNGLIYKSTDEPDTVLMIKVYIYIYIYIYIIYFNINVFQVLLYKFSSFPLDFECNFALTSLNINLADQILKIPIKNVILSVIPKVDI